MSRRASISLSSAANEDGRESNNSMVPNAAGLHEVGVEMDGEMRRRSSGSTASYHAPKVNPLFQRPALDGGEPA